MKRTMLLLFVIILLQSLNVYSQKEIVLIKDLKDYVLVPQGKVQFEMQQFDVEAFYISKYEVTTELYREFLDTLIKNKEYEKLAIAQIDSNQWNKAFNGEFNQPLVDMYSNHPAYKKYPIVNISYEGALLFCEWLGEKYNRLNTDKSLIYEFNLPTKIQWMRAARGNSPAPYAWDSPHLLGKLVFCNFKRLNSENIHYNPQTKQYEIIFSDINSANSVDITAPVKSYEPNQFGLYNVCGNVAEMISDKGTAMGGSWNDTGYDVRVESSQDYQHGLPFIGFRPMLTLVKK